MAQEVPRPGLRSLQTVIRATRPEPRRQAPAHPSASLGIPRSGSLRRSPPAKRRSAMSKVRVHNFVVTLDGFASGEGQSLEAAFGHAQKEFLRWFRDVRVWRGLAPDGKFGVDEAIASAWETGIGVEIMGRNKFRHTTGRWPDDGWRGWWGEDPPFHTPCFIWTHYPRDPMKLKGGTTYYFVDGTPAEVLALAHKAAGDLDVRIGGGPTTVN